MPLRFESSAQTTPVLALPKEFQVTEAVPPINPLSSVNSWSLCGGLEVLNLGAACTVIWADNPRGHATRHIRTEAATTRAREKIFMTPSSKVVFHRSVTAWG